MTHLVTEFLAHNDVTFDAAYNRARRYVGDELAVEVIDVYRLRPEARGSVELSMYAAAHPPISSDANCMHAMMRIDSKQTAAASLYVGIAAIGPDAADAVPAIAASLGPVRGPARWIEAAANADELYDRIVRWLVTVLDLRGTSPGPLTLAQEMNDTIESSLPVNLSAQTGLMRFWGIS